MIIKLIDQIRKWKKDNNDKELDWNNLEILAQQFDTQNEIELEKIKILKDKSALENKKLSLEIEKIKTKEKFFCTQEGTCFKISTLKSVSRLANGRFDITFTNSPIHLRINSTEHIELLEKLK